MNAQASDEDVHMPQGRMYRMVRQEDLLALIPTEKSQVYGHYRVGSFHMYRDVIIFGLTNLIRTKENDGLR